LYIIKIKKNTIPEQKKRKLKNNGLQSLVVHSNFFISFFYTFWIWGCLFSQSHRWSALEIFILDSCLHKPFIVIFVDLEKKCKNYFVVRKYFFNKIFFYKNPNCLFWNNCNKNNVSFNNHSIKKVAYFMTTKFPLTFYPSGGIYLPNPPFAWFNKIKGGRCVLKWISGKKLFIHF